MHNLSFIHSLGFLLNFSVLITFNSSFYFLYYCPYQRREKHLNRLEDRLPRVANAIIIKNSIAGDLYLIPIQFPYVPLYIDEKIKFSLA